MVLFEQPLKSNAHDEQIYSLSEKLEINKTELLGVIDQLASTKQELNNSASKYKHVPVTATTQHSLNEITDLRIVPYSQNDNLEPVFLQNFEDVLVHLEKNLNRLGIKLSHARHLSVDILSAIIVGQLVTVSGSLAFVVAETIASTLASNSVLLVKIPLGLLNSNSFDLIFESLDLNIKGSPKAIIIEGLNRSAFEVYGSTLQKFITNRILQINTNLQVFFFATITEGPSVLLPGKEIIELGPVFHTDALGWMDKFATTAIPGQFDLGIFDSVLSLPSSNYLDKDDLRLPEWIFNGAGVMWRKSIMTAELLSYSLWKSKNVEHDYLNTAFGWLVPMVLLMDKAKVTEFIDSVQLDDRSKALIRLNFIDEDANE